MINARDKVTFKVDINVRWDERNGGFFNRITLLNDDITIPAGSHGTVLRIIQQKWGQEFEIDVSHMDIYINGEHITSVECPSIAIDPSHALVQLAGALEE